MYKISFFIKTRDYNGESCSRLQQAYAYAGDVVEALAVFQGVYGKDANGYEIVAITRAHLEILNHTDQVADKYVMAR
jgi:hypothetical protein